MPDDLYVWALRQRASGLTGQLGLFLTVDAALRWAMEHLATVRGSVKARPQEPDNAFEVGLWHPASDGRSWWLETATSLVWVELEPVRR